MSSEDAIEQTLHLCKEVAVYKIPPRPGAGGWRSGEWRVSDKIFEGRLRVVAIGERCEVRIEDISTNEIFAVCPVPIGKKGTAVEPVTDSSRYYVLRVEDPVTKRHAFLGLGFADRGESFDFSVTLADHDKHVQREKCAAVLNSSASSSSNKDMDEEMASLYRETGDLSLKEGQTIRINVKRSANKASTSSSSSGSNHAVQLTALPPPPAPSTTSQALRLKPNPQTSSRVSDSGAASTAASDPGLKTTVTSSWATFD